MMFVMIIDGKVVRILLEVDSENCGHFETIHCFEKEDLVVERAKNRLCCLKKIEGDLDLQ